MNIYLASRYSRIGEMQAARADLVAAGHTVTARWVNGDHQAADDNLDSPLAAGFALDDCEDLRKADCVISFTEAPRTGATRGGRHVEFGLALALGKRAIVIGHRENVFHSLPYVEFFPSWAQAYRAIA